MQDSPHGKPSSAAFAMGASTEPGKMIGTKMSFQVNYSSVCGTIVAAIVLDAMPVNDILHNALSNDKVAECLEL